MSLTLASSVSLLSSSKKIFRLCGSLKSFKSFKKFCPVNANAKQRVANSDASASLKLFKVSVFVRANAFNLP